MRPAEPFFLGLILMPTRFRNHLYESFFAGCIPLILSDRYVLPFQESLTLYTWGSR